MLLPWKIVSRATRFILGLGIVPRIQDSSRFHGVARNTVSFRQSFPFLARGETIIPIRFRLSIVSENENRTSNDWRNESVGLVRQRSFSGRGSLVQRRSLLVTVRLGLALLAVYTVTGYTVRTLQRRRVQRIHRRRVRVELRRIVDAVVL